MIGSYRAAIEKHRMISLEVLPRFTEYRSQRVPKLRRAYRLAGGTSLKGYLGPQEVLIGAHLRPLGVRLRSLCGYLHTNSEVAALLALAVSDPSFKPNAIPG